MSFCQGRKGKKFIRKSTRNACCLWLEQQIHEALVWSRTANLAPMDTHIDRHLLTSQCLLLGSHVLTTESVCATRLQFSSLDRVSLWQTSLQDLEYIPCPFSPPVQLITASSLVYCFSKTKKIYCQ